ncbi:MAG: hypothetical protein WKG00_03345 [Polyangiaceae bacterium]
MVIERAGRQTLPADVLELLPAREDEYGLLPGPHDTIADRRQAYAARKRQRGGADRLNVERELRAALGDDFLVLRETPIDEAAVWPASAGDQPMNLQRPETPRKLVRILDPISTGFGVVQEVEYERIESESLLVGETIVVEPDVLGISERVTVEYVDAGGSQRWLSATFNEPHTAGCMATTAPWPWWRSTKRHSLVVLTEEAAANPVKRNKVHDVMRRLARGVSTWDVTSSADGLTTTGPFTIGGGMIGITTIGQVSL